MRRTQQVRSNQTNGGLITAPVPGPMPSRELGWPWRIWGLGGHSGSGESPKCSKGKLWDLVATRDERALVGARSKWVLVGHSRSADTWGALEARTLGGNEFILLKWPPQSPDLNPIEHIWDVVEREIRIMDVQPTNLHVNMDQNKSLRNVSNALLSLFHKELRQFCRQKGVQTGPSRCT